MTLLQDGSLRRITDGNVTELINLFGELFEPEPYWWDLRRHLPGDEGQEEALRWACFHDNLVDDEAPLYIPLPDRRTRNLFAVDDGPSAQEIWLCTPPLSVGPGLLERIRIEWARPPRDFDPNRDRLLCDLPLNAYLRGYTLAGLMEKQAEHWDDCPISADTVALIDDALLRLRKICEDEERAFTRTYLRALQGPDGTDEQAAEAEVQYERDRAAWNAKYGHLFVYEDTLAAAVAPAAPTLTDVPGPRPYRGEETREASPAKQEGRKSLITGTGTPPQMVAPEYSEIELAERFVRSYQGNIHYVPARGQWLHWNGMRWCADETGYVADLVRQHCQSEAALCLTTPGQTAANARSLCSDKTVRAVVRLATIDQRVATRASEWDQNPWIIGTPDGVVDLKEGVLRAARPEDRVTKSTAVSPAGECPLWLVFLHRATGGDGELLSYLHRLYGYMLTGSVREESLYFKFGPGRTGKGTSTHVVSKILADYHVTTAIETITESKQDRHPAEVAALQGARLVTCSETEKGRQ
jgi:hypothetical protein